MMALAAAVDMAAQAAPGINRFQSVVMSAGLAEQVPIGDDDFGALRKAGLSDAHMAEIGPNIARNISHIE